MHFTDYEGLYWPDSLISLDNFNLIVDRNFIWCSIELCGLINAWAKLVSLNFDAICLDLNKTKVNKPLKTAKFFFMAVNSNSRKMFT